MPTYAAFLGNQPLLSLSELHAVLPGISDARLVGRSTVIFSVPTPIAREELATWGGTMLIAEELQAKGKPEDVPGLLHKAIGGLKGKVTFAIRAEGVSPDIVRNLYRHCKDRLKKEGLPSRYVGNERQPAATALLRDAKLLDGTGGAEIVLIRDEKHIWIGRAIAAQDPDAYTERDMHKPVRDTRAGMLPPKLAQILLNFGWMLTGGRSHQGPLVVFDPFCGTGVIPLEVALRGWTILASDSSAKAVAGCETNLDWLRKVKKLKKSDAPATIWKQDARKPFALKEKPDVIVSETALGPALTIRPTATDCKKYAAEADALETEFLQNVAASLPGVPLVITWPVWYLKNGAVRLEKTWQKFEKIGYRVVPPPGLPAESLERPTITYRRGDQFVGREIVLFTLLH
jgi:hypothetical protein